MSRSEWWEFFLLINGPRLDAQLWKVVIPDFKFRRGRRVQRIFCTALTFAAMPTSAMSEAADLDRLLLFPSINFCALTSEWSMGRGFCPAPESGLVWQLAGFFALRPKAGDCGFPWSIHFATWNVLWQMLRDKEVADRFLKRMRGCGGGSWPVSLLVVS